MSGQMVHMVGISSVLFNSFGKSFLPSAAHLLWTRQKWWKGMEIRRERPGQEGSRKEHRWDMGEASFHAECEILQTKGQRSLRIKAPFYAELEQIQKKKRKKANHINSDLEMNMM